MEFRDLPHIIFTSGNEWDPQVLDLTLSTDDNWYNTVKELSDGHIHTPFDEYGNYVRREPDRPATDPPDVLNGEVDDAAGPPLVDPDDEVMSTDDDSVELQVAELQQKA